MIKFYVPKDLFKVIMTHICKEDGKKVTTTFTVGASVWGMVYSNENSECKVVNAMLTMDSSNFKDHAVKTIPVFLDTTTPETAIETMQSIVETIDSYFNIDYKTFICEIIVPVFENISPVIVNAIDELHAETMVRNILKTKLDVEYELRFKRINSNKSGIIQL